MKKKVFVYTIYILLIVLIQSVLMNLIKYNDVKPSLPLVFIVAVALLRGSGEGAVVGLFTGFALDMVSGRGIGFNALLGMYSGLIIGLANRRIYRENYFAMLFFTFASTLVYENLVYLLRVLPNNQTDLLYVIRYIIVPEAIYNSIASIPIFLAAIRMSRRLDRIETAARKY